MATIPIHNPQSPFLGLIPGGFRNGSTLRIRAQIQGFSNRFVINLQSGAALKPCSDVMLHLSFRPAENAIVRNHLKDQVWGPEERHGANTVQAHQFFDVSIIAEPSHYRVLVNGVHFCTFSHRLPLSLVKYVSISGTATVQYILIDQHSGHHVPSHPSVRVPINPMYPIHPMPAPMPPPMPPTAPPPYPGIYPGHQHPTPYTTPDKTSEKKSLKVAAGVGAAVGLSAIALSRAVRRNK